MICELAHVFLIRKDSYTVSSITSYWEKIIEIALKSQNESQKQIALKIVLYFSPKIIYSIMSEMINMPIYTILYSYCVLLIELKKSDMNVYYFDFLKIFQVIRTMVNRNNKYCKKYKTNPCTY